MARAIAGEERQQRVAAGQGAVEIEQRDRAASVSGDRRRLRRTSRELPIIRVLIYIISNDLIRSARIPAHSARKVTASALEYRAVPRRAAGVARAERAWMV